MKTSRVKTLRIKLLRINLSRIRNVYILILTGTVIGLVFLAGCSSTTTTVKSRVYRPKSNVYVPQYQEEEQRPKATPETQNTMIASWYGTDFNGKPTASGERYDMYSYSAAHKYLPFGTIIKVTNPSTGISARVVVNDRGPFVAGRDIDLSYQAAKDIGLVRSGVGVINVEYLGRDNKYVKYIRVSDQVAKGLYTIQIASFEDQQNAERMKKSLELGYQTVYIRLAKVNGKTFYRVRVGKFGGKQKAIERAQKLADEGYDTFVTGEEG
ncbi:MAG: septal ring lytic transglycosylase RlpA family protein [Nitrospirae bacterium]|nr:septal ring lytic transglycosylase RlpA family protein [Nitrospirota bacterium]